MESEPSLSEEEIRDMISEKLEGYKKLSFLEQYAMFMGKAQILEFGLKSLLSNKYEIESEEMERWTLGKLKNELAQKGLRSDFIALLDSLVQSRNYIAHELLANNALLNSLVELSPRIEGRELWKATYELEQIIILHDWCVEHNAWD
jgi:hypothetical protein